MCISKSGENEAYAMSHLKGIVLPNTGTGPCEEDDCNEDGKNHVSDYKRG